MATMGRDEGLAMRFAGKPDACSWIDAWLVVSGEQKIASSVNDNTMASYVFKFLILFQYSVYKVR